MAKPKLPKAERKALRFAYELIRGTQTRYLPYVHGLLLQRQGDKIILRSAGWIEPDQDPERPYLNETIFTRLMMLNYFECDQFLSDSLWLYRLSRDGCSAMGWDWPLRINSSLNNKTPAARRQQQEHFQNQKHIEQIRYQKSYHRQRSQNFPRHRLYHRLHK